MRTNNAKICHVWPKMCFTYVVYVCSDISLSECYPGSMERWGREESKTELKECYNFPMTNVTYLNIFRTLAQKEDITLFDSNSTSIHSLINQHVYTLKNSTAFMVVTAPGLRKTHKVWGRKYKFSQLCKRRLALKHILMVDSAGTKTSRIPKGQIVRNKDYQYRNQAWFFAWYRLIWFFTSHQQSFS